MQEIGMAVGDTAKILTRQSLCGIFISSDGIQGVRMGSCEPVLGMPG